MSHKWSSRDTYEFVKEYRMHSCLWDINDPNYRRRIARDAALSAIVKKIRLDGFDVAAARKKLRIIRSSYWNEHHKIHKSAAEGKIYRPKAAWFNEADKFLRKVINWGDESFSWPSIEDDNNLPVQHESLESYVEKSTTPISITANYPLVEVHSEQQSINGSHQNLGDIRSNFGERCKFEQLPMYEDSNYFKSRKSRKELSKKRQKKGKDLSEATKALNALVEQTKPEDEYEIFGKSIASHLRNMSTKDSLICQKQILDFIIDHRLKNLEERNSV